jgi:hypothetical protein
MPLIAEYLVHLGRHEEACQAFRKDPDHAMECFGLSKDQRAAVLSGDEQQLGSAIQSEFHACASGVVPSMTTKITKL